MQLSRQVLSCHEDLPGGGTFAERKESRTQGALLAL
jgi:hypothetical protein